MSGQLFTQYFLDEGIKHTPEWQESLVENERFRDFSKGLRHKLDWFDSNNVEPNEATTEQDLILPILELLGWTHRLPQQGTARNEDIPDHLLFNDATAKSNAASRAKSEDRFADILVVEESKKYGLTLDTRDKSDSVQPSTPHGQMLRYLTAADINSDGKVRWGILTNGAVWRLYDYRTRPRSTGYFEADLTAILNSGDEDATRAFWILFRRPSFAPAGGATTSFLVAALAEGKRYEERVAQDLSGVVFDRVFPELVQAIDDASDAELSEIRQAALIFLYRLLFVLFAEDRGLLPVNESRYADYGLRRFVRDDINRRYAEKDVFSNVASIYYNRLMTLSKLVDKGDPSIGLPPYNGGLFNPDSAPLLDHVELPDSVVAPILYDLSHTGDGDNRSFVNYRDMSVQQLGSIYERLLEREPVRDQSGKITIRPNPYARKDSGSFYTPQPLVDLIIDWTLKPLVEERLKAFEEKSKILKRDRRPKAAREAELRRLDPAEAVLNLRVLDPAMGSGHFLVAAVDFLSDYVQMMLEYLPAVPDWVEDQYVSPLVNRINAIREGILTRAEKAGWTIDDRQLTDQAIIRRMILKRCIYGVDKNPLTVELAKVSLWLHSFTVGAPLSFLDHHLRCGDSLVGMKIKDATSDLARLGGMYSSSPIQSAENAAEGMIKIEQISDADIAEVEESAMLFQRVESATSELRGVLDTLCGVRWLNAGMKVRDRTDQEEPLVASLALQGHRAFELIGRGPEHTTDDDPIRTQGFWPAFKKLWKNANDVAREERFFHWEAAFPGVWQHWQNSEPVGGFDAVIGNPPWDKIKLQEVEWFETRSPDIANAPNAAHRKAHIRRLSDESAPLAAEFDAAKERADKLSSLFRGNDDYPFLGRGDINLYSLFVERAMNLVKPDGLIGLLTPSGIYADKTAAPFFKSVSSGGRVGGIFDFENRRLTVKLPPFFPDVEKRFKFCALIFGGESRRFKETRCGFFLDDPENTMSDNRSFPLSPTDFDRINPNTGTAPIFRNRRDAEITRRIYKRHPVLVDRSDGDEVLAWPIKYVSMFHMTNDSHHFCTADRLEADGYYRIENNCWRKADELYIPLYQGRMIHNFDHRANSIGFNPNNTHNPYVSIAISDAQRTDPAFLPRVHNWVPRQEVDKRLLADHKWSIAFRDFGRSNDERTMKATVVPRRGFGNQLPLLLPNSQMSARDAVCLTANLCSFALDYVARQKVQGTHLNKYIVEQLPVIAPTDYHRMFGPLTAHNLVYDHVLRLTYTAHDMEPFARDLGYEGPPFTWDPEERRHLRARLDALYFHLYGINRDDADYILSTFPIVRKQDEDEFGNYRTRELILAYMNALAAGDTETVVAI